MTIALSNLKRGKLKRKETQTGFRPRHVLDLELSQPLPALARSGRYAEALLLVRLYGYPIAHVAVSLERSFTSSELAAELWQSLAPSINTFLKRHGLEPATSLSDSRLEDLGLSLTAKREAFWKRAPLASVVICTRDRPESLERCLRAALTLEYPHYEIIVVDNAPKSDTTKRAVEKFSGVRYVLEPEPGLSVARNTALRHVKGDIVAFLDDDETADNYWLLELARGFERAENVSAVFGVTVPAELETQAQVWFEDFVSQSKGRSFTPDLFKKTSHSPLAVALGFGVGGNMAFKTKAIRTLGFDLTLGAGTPVQTGEDKAAFFDVMMAGQTVAYQPSAIMRHYHRRDKASLCAQLYGYGLGRTAFYVRCLRKHPHLTLELASHFREASFYKSKARLKTLPRDLISARRQGLVNGFAAYLKSCRQNLKKS
jgi:glycosyltransferase involved in cell wall biosynthesis